MPGSLCSWATAGSTWRALDLPCWLFGIYGIPVLIAVYAYYVCFRARWAATLALAACSAAAFAGAHVAGERWMQWLALASVLTAAAFVHHLVLSVAESFEKARTERIG
jgi:hypothetical protein